MRLTNGFDISASALTAQRLRMDVISSNIANADTTRGKLVNGKWEPYQRKLVTLEPKTQQSFDQMLKNAMTDGTGEGVKVTKIFLKIRRPQNRSIIRAIPTRMRTDMS